MDSILVIAGISKELVTDAGKLGTTALALAQASKKLCAAYTSPFIAYIMLMATTATMEDSGHANGDEGAVGVMDDWLNRQLSLDTMSEDDVEVEVNSSSWDADNNGGTSTGLMNAASTRDTEGNGDNEDENNRIHTSPSSSSNNNINSIMCFNWDWSSIYYLSLFSTIGVTMRAYMSRLFGDDCEAYNYGTPINDFLWPLSHQICITTSGLTEQYGGALFLDLPGNMFGSFIMGIMTGHSSEWPAIPFFAHDHPLQDNKGLHVGIRTALCGSLTTFSSWNTQMVEMMDGTANPYLGPQVLAALFGYILGLQASLISFRAGRRASAWGQLRHNPHLFDSDLDKMAMKRKCHHDHIGWIIPVATFIIVGTLIGLYVLGDVYWGIPFYRELWIACLVAPIGTLTRWKLSTLNGRFSIRGIFWFPTGTFSANVLGSILSVGLGAWLFTNQITGRWKVTAIEAVSLGVAGSLSTVSSFAKETVEISEKYPTYDKKAFFYSHGSMLCCCFVGLLVYSPIVRNA